MWIIYNNLELPIVCVQKDTGYWPCSVEITDSHGADSLEFADIRWLWKWNKQLPRHHFMSTNPGLGAGSALSLLSWNLDSNSITDGSLLCT